MSNHGVGWLFTVISVDIWNGGSEFCDVLQCLDELKLAHSEVRGAVVFATFSLYLVLSHSQLGLFLAEPPFVSAVVAPLL